jgi:hypothetical protein
MRLVLKIRAGSDAGSEIFIEQGARVRVGRKSPSEYVFPDDPGISRQHFCIECTADTGRVQDLNSSNGTWVNGQRISDAVLQEGDQITAGGMTFVVHLERDQALVAPPSAAKAAAPPSYSQPQLSVELPLGPIENSPPAAAKPAAPAAPEISLEERLLGMFREDFQPLYAILDAARSPQIYKILAEAKEDNLKAWEAQNPGAAGPASQPPAAGMLEGGAQYESLFEGWSKAQLALFAPYLVSLPPWSKLLEKLVTKGWGKSWGVYLTSHVAFAEIRHHFRHFLMVNMPDGNQVYFRFYDPRVLRIYLPTCTPEEIAYFFGPVSRFAIENEEPETLLEFVRRQTGMQSNVIQLAPPEKPAGGLASPSRLEKTQPPVNPR